MGGIQTLMPLLQSSAATEAIGLEKGLLGQKVSAVYASLVHSDQSLCENYMKLPAHLLNSHLTPKLK